MSNQTSKLSGLRPEPSESLDVYLARGQKINDQDRLDFRPQEGDSVGEYLLRLRTANELTPDEVERLLGVFPRNVNVTSAELDRLENSDPEVINEKRLRLLATLYGVPQNWVLQVANYPVASPTPLLPATDNLFATMTMRSLPPEALDSEAQEMLKKIFDEIVAAVQQPRSDLPPES